VFAAPPVLLPLLPQAATNSAALLAMAVAATALVTERKKTTSFLGGTPIGMGLLRRPIGVTRGIKSSSDANTRGRRMNGSVNIDVTT
jgi:hypothetical protein